MRTEISHELSSTSTAVSGDAKSTRRPNVVRRVIALVMMFMLTGVAALSFASSANADDEVANYSFYQLSSSLAAFFSNASSPDENAAAIDTDVWGSVVNQPGSAGAMLGYVDPDFSFSVEFLNSQISGSSSAVGYDTLVQSSQGDGSSSTATPGMLDYAHFGATVNAMGLDSMGTGLSLGFFAPLGGGAMMLLYIFTGVVDLLFVGIISMLKILNPFTLFYEGVRLVNPTFADGMTGGQAPPGFLGGLSSFIGEWYLVLNNIAWAVLVPLFIGVLLLSLLLAKNMNRGGALKKLVVRVAFIGLGLPLVGSMYTGVLNSMGDASSAGSAGSTQVVLSTYVDFENWALKSRLSVPDDAIIAWDATEGEPTDEALANVRNTSLAINKSANGAWSSINSSLNVDEGQSWTEAAMQDTEGDSSGGLSGYMATMDLLGRYISGSKIDAASYETTVKGDISTSGPYTNGEDGRAQVSEWFVDFSDPENGLPEIEDPNKVLNNPVVRVDDGLTADPAGATTGEKVYTTPSGVAVGCENWVSSGSGEPLNCNMSTLSVYNYLNTSFGSDSMTMYSSNRSTSGATREMHNSVTQVGTGVMSGLYWTNSMVLLGSFVIIGLGYAFSLLFANIRRSFQLITAIPFATIGAMAGIAKVIIYAMAMILEVIVTLFIYRFVQVFLISIPQIVEMPFSAVLNGVSGGDAAVVNLLSGGTLSMVMTVLSIISLIAFTVLALRIRKTLVKAINEVVTKLVDKFMDTNVAPPGGGGGGAMPALAGGLASGAGMAAANKAMGGGGFGGGKKSAGGDGPGGIKAGGIPVPGGGPGGGKPGGPAGALSVGGGAGMDISGAMGGNGAGGPNGGPGDPVADGPDGPGNPGGPLALTSGGDTDGSARMLGAGSGDQSTARALEAQGGLSEPGSRGSGDVTDTMAGSIEQTQGQYNAKDRATADGALAGAKTLGKGAEAAGRGFAGDVPGAVGAGVGALGHAKDVQGSAANAQAIQKDIDAPATAERGNVSGESAGGTSGSGTQAPGTPGATGGAEQAPTSAGSSACVPNAETSAAAGAAGGAAGGAAALAAGNTGRAATAGTSAAAGAAKAGGGAAGGAAALAGGVAAKTLKSGSANTGSTAPKSGTQTPRTQAARTQSTGTAKAPVRSGGTTPTSGGTAGAAAVGRRTAAPAKPGTTGSAKPGNTSSGTRPAARPTTVSPTPAKSAGKAGTSQSSTPRQAPKPTTGRRAAPVVKQNNTAATPAPKQTVRRGTTSNPVTRQAAPAPKQTARPQQASAPSPKRQQAPMSRPTPAAPTPRNNPAPRVNPSPRRQQAPVAPAPRTNTQAPRTNTGAPRVNNPAPAPAPAPRQSPRVRPEVIRPKGSAGSPKKPFDQDQD